MTTIRRTVAWGALAGLLAGALAVAVGMLSAAITEVVSPIDAVGSEVIDRSPRWLTEWAIREFGSDDKLALRVGICVILGLAALGIGAAATRWRWVGLAGIGSFGVVGALAAAHRPTESAGAAVPSIVGAIVGAVVLRLLLRPRPVPTPGESQVPLGWDRRRFLAASGTAAAAAVAGGLGRGIENGRVGEIRAATKDPLPALPSGDRLVVPSGADADPSTPFITPNDAFYRVDTAFSFPRIDVATWRVDITGMVDRPATYTYRDLLDLPQVERMITICCVSNEVGGPYIGNAVWRGVLLGNLLDEAGVQPDAEQVYSTSLDGWTCGFPVAAATDGRDAIIALGMNGAALPLEHGYPARLIVPGLYGYVSATKWLSTIELTSWAKEGYWVPLGWAQQAPIKTQSRIGHPRHNANLAAGPQKIAGVAWAQHRGIEKVEVQVDDGPWQETHLATDASDDAWRQWVIDWEATTGAHWIRVRATDKTGETQTEEPASAFPDGATGYHRIKVKVG